jgi:hypothetical protein
MDVMILSYVVAIAVSFGVGIPVLVRSWRHRDGRLALLGAAVTFDGLEWLAWALCLFTPAYGTPLGDALGIASRVGVAASVLCMIAFTRVTFRPDGSAARVVTWLLVGALLAGFFGSGLAGDWIGVRSDLAWLWLEQCALVLGLGWAALESGRYHLLMRRRVKLGLAEPLVANRFLLWSVYAGLFCLGQLQWDISLVFYGAVSTLDVLTVGMTVAAEAALFMAVFPPVWYARRVRAAAGASD